MGKEKLVEENGPDILDSPDFVNLLKDKIKLNNDSLNEEEIDVIVSDIIGGGKKVQNGDYAFLKDGTGRIFERGIVGGSPDGMWILSSLKEIDFEQDICNQQGKNYEELEVDDLIDDDTCVYDEEHCIPNRENRMKLQIKSLQKQLESVSEDIDKISKIENFKIETQKEISILTNKNLRYKKIEENHSKNQIKEFEKLDKKYSDMKDKKKHKIFKILKKIMKDRNIVRRNINLSKLLNNRNYVREALEEEDPDWLYILETNEKLISVHWLLKIQITLEPENSQKILQELIDKYGIYERGSEQIISRVDGDPLREIDNEIFEGFEDDDGGFKNSRGILLEEKVFSVKDIKKELYKKGSLEYDIYNILSKILKIIYIEMNEEDINEIVKDTKITLKSSSGLISQEEWVINELDRKITKKKIDRKKYDKSKDYKKSQDKIIEEDYQNYRIQIVLFFTVARLFIQLQTAIPDYKIQGIYAGCNYSLNGYPLEDVDKEEDTNGITYFSCILNGLKKGEEPWNVIKSWKNNKIRKSLVKIIQQLLQENSKLSEKYKLKKKDIEEKESKTLYIDKKKNSWNEFKPNLTGMYQLQEPEINIREISEQLELSKKSNSSLFQEKLKELEIRNNWLSSQILKEINNILSSEELEYRNLLGTPLEQNSCCYNNIINYQNYFDFFVNKNSTIESLAGEMKVIQGIYNSYMSSYLTPFHLINKYPFQITQSNIPVLPINIKENQIYSLFLLFSNREETFGENRIFNKFGRCKITGEVSEAYLPNLSMENRIQKLKLQYKTKGGYTVGDYNIFLEKLYKKNIINYETLEFTKNFNEIIDELLEKYSFLNKQNVEEESDFVNPISYLKSSLLSKFESGEESFDDIYESFNEFIQLEIDMIIKQLSSNISMDDTETEQIENILKNIGNMNNIYNENIENSKKDVNSIQKINEKKEISQINLIKNYIQKYIIVNISKIKNKKNNLIINIPKSWKISEKHSDIVKEIIDTNQNYMDKFINLSNQIPKYNELFSDISSNLQNITNILNNLLGTNNITNCNDEIVNSSKFSTKSCSLLMHYIFLRILHFILNKNNLYYESYSDESSSSKKDDSLSSKSSSSLKSKKR